MNWEAISAIGQTIGALAILITLNYLAIQLKQNTAANSDQLKDYLRLDVSTIYTTQLSNKTDLQAGISIWNLLNRENTINTFFRLDNLGNSQKVIQTSLGITPNATVKFLFN